MCWKEAVKPPAFDDSPTVPDFNSAISWHVDHGPEWDLRRGGYESLAWPDHLLICCDALALAVYSQLGPLAATLDAGAVR